MQNNIAVFHESSFACEKDGAQARVAEMLDRVCANFDHVTVYSYSNHHAFPWTDNCRAKFSQRWPTTKLVLEKCSFPLRMSFLLKNLLIALFPAHAERIIKMSVPFLAPSFRSIKTSHAACLVNFKSGLVQLNGVDPRQCIVDTHDLFWLKFSKIQNLPTYSLRTVRKLRGEIAALSAARGVIAISSSEAVFFKMMLYGAETFYVPSWVKQPAPKEAVYEAVEYDLVFAASDYVMNVRGFCDMLRSQGHWMKKYKIAVCGLVCQHPDIIAAASENKNITLLGFVDDIEALYRKCRASIAPVDGTGLKIKIMSALRYGLPAFASKHAREGLPPGCDDAVFPISEASIDSVLKDDTILSRARSAALKYYTSFATLSESELVIDGMKLLSSNAQSFL